MHTQLNHLSRLLLPQQSSATACELQGLHFRSHRLELLDGVRFDATLLIQLHLELAELRIEPHVGLKEVLLSLVLALEVLQLLLLRVQTLNELFDIDLLEELISLHFGLQLVEALALLLLEVQKARLLHVDLFDLRFKSFYQAFRIAQSLLRLGELFTQHVLATRRVAQLLP